MGLARRSATQVRAVPRFVRPTPHSDGTLAKAGVPSCLVFAIGTLAKAKLTSCRVCCSPFAVHRPSRAKLQAASWTGLPRPSQSNYILVFVPKGLWGGAWPGLSDPEPLPLSLLYTELLWHTSRCVTVSDCVAADILDNSSSCTANEGGRIP